MYWIPKTLHVPIHEKALKDQSNVQRSIVYRLYHMYQDVLTKKITAAKGK